jgi:hypothetical protein
MGTYQQVSTTQQNTGAGQRRFTFQATQLIWLFLGLLEALFALRFMLKLLGANPANPFATLLYNFTGAFLVPFIGLTPTPAAAGMVMEVSTVIAMVVYAWLGWVLERVVWVIFYRPYAEAGVTKTTVTDRRTP